MVKIEDFIQREADRIWDRGGKHQVDCLQRLQRLIRYTGNVELSAIKTDHIHDFLESLERQGMTPATVTRYGAAIRKVFNYAADIEAIDKAPRFKIKKQAKKRVRYFSEEELQKLYDFYGYYKKYRGGLQDWLYHMIVVADKTGMRLSEILSLRTGQTEIIEDADGHWLVLHDGDTKNGEGRWVPIAGDGLASAQRLAMGFKYSHRIFYDTWQQARRVIAKGDKDFVFHVFRHTAATRMANDFGVNTVLVAEWLGHKRLETTQKYVHPKRSHMQEIASKLG